MSNPNDYTVGWICAISTEYVAAQAFLDEGHEGPEHVSKNDNNDYTLGKVGRHNVVIAVLPNGEYGTASAAMVARDMLSSFPNIRFGLMVGIGGGAPSTKHDIRLGDIVVSAPRDEKGGVFQYDFGKTIQGQSFQATRFLNQPPTILRTALNGLEAQYELKGHQLESTISHAIKENPKLRKKYKRPDPSSDRLYCAEITHPANDATSCATVCGNDQSKLVLRPERSEDDDNPEIHYGLIASANQLMKDATVRDKLAAEKDVLCFEMEAAGLMNHFPCLVIRGICDYSDSHKNKEWQGYAAMAAAAYAKDLLCRIAPNRVENEKRISDIISDVQQGIGQLLCVQHNQEHVSILNWLTAIDYADQQHDFINRRQEGTGQWLLDSAEFKEWIESDKQTLFCPGIPGAGKTILTAIVIEELTSRFYHDKSIGIAYLYCNFRRQDEQKAAGLLASLLKQFAEYQTSLPNGVEDLYNQHKKKRTRPSFDELARTLLSVASLYQRVFIVVDALDECQASDSNLSTFLSQIFDLQTRTRLNFFATSRPIPHIVAKFKNCHSRDILASNDDVHRYLQAHMVHLPKFVLRNADLQEKIKMEITGAVEGMFLLAQLYLDSLKDKTSVTEMNCALKELKKQNQPATGEDRKRHALNKAYDQAMKRIDGQMPGFQILGRKVLSWITCAKRPLTALELQHALAVNIGDIQLDSNNIRDVEDMVSVCAGLVTLEESGIIRLVHYTTQEYFEQTQRQWFPNAQTDITKICVTYLSFDEFENGICQTDKEFEERLESNPLYDYASHNWGHHAREASMLILEVISFLKRKTQVDASIQGLLAVKQYSSGTDYSQIFPKDMTGLHLAAYFGVEAVVKLLLEHQARIESKDSGGRTPLSWAAEHGHKAVVRLLLEHQAEIELKDRFGRTPLLWAAEHGHEAVVRLLLEHQAEIKSKDRFGQTPLSRAAERGHKAVVRLLLEHQAEIELKDRFGQTPLSRAAEKGHEAVVRLLLEHQAEIESKDDDGRTPLSRAAEKGHEAVVRLLLLEHQAEIESKDRFGQTPLLWAAEHGHEAVVRLLLEHQAEIKSKDRFGQTPLSRAAEKGHEAVVRLLLEHQAEIELKDRFGRTPLSRAAEHGHKAVVRLLLEHQAEIESKDRFGQTPLSRAAWSGHKAVVRLLLEHQAKIESKDRFGRTPLSRAAEKGHEAVVRLLLEHQAEIESKDRFGQTPLSRAAWSGHKAVVRLLLEHQAKIESKDDDGQTPLSQAAEHGHEAVVRLLLEHQAEIESKDRFGQTPLSQAAEHGHKAVVRLLLEHQAEIESKDRYGQTPLSRAAEHGHEAVVRLLLEHQAEIESKDRFGQTPLSWAACNGDEAVVRLLLEHQAEIESKDRYGQTPLSRAAWSGRKAVVRLLLEHQAEIMSKDDDSQTPLSWAACNGHEAVVRLLLKHQAKIESKDNDRETLLWRDGRPATTKTNRETPLHKASNSRHFDIVK